MPHRNTETDKGNILTVKEIKFKDFGIEIWFTPLKTRCLLSPFQNFATKDLIPTIFYGTQGMQSVVLHTSCNAHQIYFDSKRLQISEELQNNILKVGDPIFEIIEL